ncbi:MAG: retroviral-like aspartic protease family protein [Sphingomonadaceae bacterium]|nr:retroviral-like aspartic protease family protein [Sphingomonadaceae bacterium]
MTGFPVEFVSAARRGILLLALAATASAAQVSTSASRVAPPADPDAPALVGTGNDQAMRMTVPVTIDGHGPYRFVVDTGADRTVVSREVATALRLEAGNPATLHSMSGVGEVATVILRRLGIAGRTTNEIHAPALEQSNLGANGLLGLDTLKGRRIIMDFRRKTLSILASGEREPTDPDTIVVTARTRFGQLVLVDADVDGAPITVIIDTGAQNTIGNGALRRILGKRNRHLEFFKTELIDVTGGRLPAEVAAVGHMRIGGLNIDDLVVAFADAHPFARFGLTDRPAMLLGMDTLRGFRRVSVDFGQRKVRFLPPGAV